MPLEDDELLDSVTLSRASQLTNYQIVNLYLEKNKFPPEIVELVEFEIERRKITTSQIEIQKTEFEKLTPIDAPLVERKNLGILIFAIFQMLISGVFEFIWGLTIFMVSLVAIKKRYKEGSSKEKQFWKRFEFAMLGINIIVWIYLAFTEP